MVTFRVTKLLLLVRAWLHAGSVRTNGAYKFCKACVISLRTDATRAFGSNFTSRRHWKPWCKNEGRALNSVESLQQRTQCTRVPKLICVACALVRRNSSVEEFGQAQATQGRTRGVLFFGEINIVRDAGHYASQTKLCHLAGDPRRLWEPRQLLISGSWRNSNARAQESLVIMHARGPIKLLGPSSSLGLQF